MPTPIQAADKLTVGGSGKHYTQAEVQSRQEAAEMVSRAKRLTLKPPKWLSPEALEVWRDTREKLKGIELLDKLDTDMLAIYCDAIAQYQHCTTLLRSGAVDEEGKMVFNEPLIKAAQSWARIVTGYAERLGLTPGGRARLAKKKAEKVVDDFADQFGG